jgi:hypothetical protein
MMFVDRCTREEAEPVNPTVDPADIRGLMPPYLRPSGACLGLGTRMPAGLITLSRVAPNRGRADSDTRRKAY